MTSNQRLIQLAGQLDQAWRTGVPIPAPTTTDPTLTVSDAYSIQDLIIGSRLNEGRRRSGWKLGLTSAGPGTTPIVGTILDDMVISSGTHVQTETMVGPKVEGELVVAIGETIDGPITTEELLGADLRIAPGIEVIDYRTIEGSGPVDWIADNSTVGYAVVGELRSIEEIRPADAAVTLFAGDHALATGDGSMVMGDPLRAVAWLSEHLHQRGLQLNQGDLILTGSMTGNHQVDPISRPSYTADFGKLGMVTVAFSG